MYCLILTYIFFINCTKWIWIKAHFLGLIEVVKTIIILPRRLGQPFTRKLRICYTPVGGQPIVLASRFGNENAMIHKQDLIILVNYKKKINMLTWTSRKQFIKKQHVRKQFVMNTKTVQNYERWCQRKAEVFPTLTVLHFQTFVVFSSILQVQRQSAR